MISITASGYNPNMDQEILKKINSFFSGFEIKRFKKGEILIEANQEPSGVFFLREGLVRMYTISLNGEELTLNIYRANSLFPLNWVLNNNLSPYYFEAMTSVTVLKAPKDKFLQFIKENSTVLLDLVSRIYRGLDGFFLRMEYLMRGSAKSRLITELLIFANRFGEVQSKQTVVKFRLSEKDLASETGLARETISREMSKLEKEGLVTLKKNTLTINNIDTLEQRLLDN